MSFSISVHVDTSGLERIAAALNTYPPQVGKYIGGQVAAEARILARINVFQFYGLYQELGFHHYRSGKFIQNAFLNPAVQHWAGQFLSASTWAPMFYGGAGGFGSGFSVGGIL